MGSKASVLVTRPAGQADALCSALEERGFRAHRQPLLELCPLPALAPADHQQLLHLDQFAHVIFISGNAVRFGMEEIESQWPQLPVGLNWYAIGSGTARLLGDYGIVPLTPAREMTSEGLLQLPTLQQVSGEKVLIVKGEGGRETLRTALEARGAVVNELRCYRRICPNLAPGELAERLVRWQIDLVQIGSGEALTNMLALLSQGESTNLRDIALLLPSRRVAREAEAMGFTNLVVAENAADAALLQALENWRPGSGDS